MLLSVYAKLRTKAFFAKEKVNEFMTKENGEVNIIAIIVILAIALALAFVFRTKITDLFNSIWGEVATNSSGYGNTDFGGSAGGSSGGGIR